MLVQREQISIYIYIYISFLVVFCSIFNSHSRKYVKVIFVIVFSVRMNVLDKRLPSSSSPPPLSTSFSKKKGKERKMKERRHPVKLNCERRRKCPVNFSFPSVSISSGGTSYFFLNWILRNTED